MRKSNYLLAALLLVLFTSCLKSTYLRRMNKNAVPSDIRNPKYTLMVEGWSTGGFVKMNNRYIEKILSKHYPDKYVLVQPEEIPDKKFEDKSKYRYLISFKWTDAVKMTGPGAIEKGIYGTTAHGVIFVFDRLTDQFVGTTEERMQSYPKSLKFFSEFVRKNR